MKPQNVIPFEARAGEIQSIKLSPEQIEEIHSDEYSLMLFYATRIEALSLEQIKRKFPEPEAKKAQAVLDRYISTGLIHKTSEGRYFSNFPVDSYLNYSDYRYDGTLETKKDQRVFEVMKEHASEKSYWLDRIYFSIDAFFSKEQSDELHAMFAEIRKKAKQFSADNKGKSVDKLRFRRLKFYDMFFMLALLFATGFGINRNANADTPKFMTMKSVLACSQPSMVMARVILAGGNDPGMRAKAFIEDDGSSCDYENTNVIDQNGGAADDPGDKHPDGGGHDPGGGGTHKSGIRPDGGGHDPGGGGTTGCDWSKYENLLSYPAEVVCSRVKEIAIEPACVQELRQSCATIKE